MSLKNVMLVNAVTSGATGAGLITASNMVADVFETNHKAPFVGVGMFLLVFTMLVYWVSRQTPINTNAVRFVIAADSLWVTASLAIVLFQVFAISMVGYWLIGAVGIWVAAMAYFQYQGLRQLIKSNV